MPRQNPLVTLLAQYCPSPENEAAFDESIHGVEERLRTRAPEVESPILARLLELLSSDFPPHIILTGTAGDGKTHVCRQVYQEFNPDGSKWGTPVVRGRLPADVDLVIVKDFTELGTEQQLKIVAELSSALYGEDDIKKVFLIAANVLIAANEGILTSKTNIHDLSQWEQQKLEDS